MKLLFIALLFSPPCYAIEHDKQLHFAAAGVISTGSYIGLRALRFEKVKSYVYAVSFSLAVGIAKELTDDHFDNKDLQYDLLGATTVPLLMLWY